jgi:hypothetical protein
MNGAVATKDNVLSLTFVHDPLTGGLKVGIPAVLLTWAERRTVTTWSDGTLVAPVAGTVDRTVSGFGAAVVVTPPPPAGS